MFKPGEAAVVRKTGQKVTVLYNLTKPYRDKSLKFKFPVETDNGLFDETELHPGHPSVLATAEGRDLSMEAFRKSMDADVKAVVANKNALVSRETIQKIEEALKEVPVDFNGHWKNGSIVRDDFKKLKDLHLGPRSMSKPDADCLMLSLESRTPMDKWVPVSSGFAMGLRICPYCGEEDFTLETNGLAARFAGEPCKFPDGLPPTEWELNVPSGKLAIANDLRKIFPLPKGEDFDINTTLGCRQTALTYAENGLSHAFVGNSCPGVYKLKDGSFKIANEPQGEKWDSEEEEYVQIDPPVDFDGEEVAGICTDLWWYSICDHAEFERRLKHFNKKAKNFDVTVVDVGPGVYRFRHNEDAARGDEGSETVYTRFFRVRAPDPVKDFLANYQEVDVNPNAYVQAQVAKWPTLYGKAEYQYGGKDKITPWAGMTDEERQHSWQCVADHVFCTISGDEWHEKGFPMAKTDSSVLDIEPPSFRAQYHWYPFSKSYGGLFRTGAMTPSFAKLAFRVLESVISFGTNVRDSEHSREVYYVKQRMAVAADRYRELAKLYPEQADPEYVLWLKQKGRAEAWVENFPLGPEFTQKHLNHAKKQRWVPEDAYAVAFDARALSEGHFAWHPKQGGCWASKENAQRYAISEFSDNGQPAEHNCFWSAHATKTSVPLYFVARVVKLGEVSHMGDTLVELAFDYGTPWMKNKSKRKALCEAKEKAGIKILTKAEYKELLPKAIEYFKKAEKEVKVTVKSK